jgi:hypothetical protein
MPGPSVFISYSTKDSDFANEFAQQLHADGCQVWIDRKELDPGEYFEEEIRSGIDNCSYFILLLSENSATSPWVRLEVEYVLSRCSADAGTVILPCRIDRHPVPEEVQHVQYVDFSDGAFHSPYQALMHVLRPDLVLPVRSAAKWTLAKRRNNLPQYHSPFCGRSRDVTLLHELILEKRERLVQLLGPGGYGKTRLAVEVGRILLEHFKDGVYFPGSCSAPKL